MSHDTPDQTAGTPDEKAAAGPAPTDATAAAPQADATAAAPAPEAPAAAATGFAKPGDTHGTPAVPPVPASDADEEVDAYVVPAGTVVTTGPGLLARIGAEAFGTFVLVLAGVGTALYAAVTQAGPLAVALAFGIAVFAGIAAVGHVSGGHFNPAVTFGAVLAGRTSWRDLLPYWLAQLVGAVAATAVLFVVVTTLPALADQERGFFSATSNGFAAHSPIAAQAGEGFSWIGAGLIELVVTAVFVGIILGATDRRSTSGAAPAAIGLALAALLLVAIPVTNGSLNPARSLATAIFSESWALEQVWLFWVAPLLGAAIAALLYRAFASEPVEDNLFEEDDVYVTTDDVLVVEDRKA
ncbi:aquaporin [Cellulomonas algicola]|uniref:aquaporin n=1 Tax=Cellulomonas algicola TaxID=2071633 RepID=UPI001C3F4EE3|nr:aquaporin [Cellulomonas algicola]